MAGLQERLGDGSHPNSLAWALAGAFTCPCSPCADPAVPGRWPPPPEEGCPACPPPFAAPLPIPQAIFKNDFLENRVAHSEGNWSGLAWEELPSGLAGRPVEGQSGEVTREAAGDPGPRPGTGDSLRTRLAAPGPAQPPGRPVCSPRSRTRVPPRRPPEGARERLRQVPPSAHALQAATGSEPRSADREPLRAAARSAPVTTCLPAAWRAVDTRVGVSYCSCNGGARPGLRPHPVPASRSGVRGPGSGRAGPRENRVLFQLLEAPRPRLRPFLCGPQGCAFPSLGP